MVSVSPRSWPSARNTVVGGSTDASVVFEGSARPSASRCGLRVSMMNAPSWTRTEPDGPGELVEPPRAGCGISEAAAPASASAPSTSAFGVDVRQREAVAADGRLGVLELLDGVEALRAAGVDRGLDRRDVAHGEDRARRRRTRPASGAIGFASPAAAGVTMVIVVPL